MSVPPSSSSTPQSGQSQSQSQSQTQTSAQSFNLFKNYTPPTGGWDELLNPLGEIRPHWESLLKSFRGLGETVVHRRWDIAKRLLQDSGISFRVATDSKPIDRPWDLDALPHLISSQDWAFLERGLTQRARLLEEMVNDLYGQQKLLRNGLIPASLLYGQQCFLRSVHGLKPKKTWLQHIAFEVARTNKGEWLVLGDRTQTPTGFGYALENRNTTIRVFPEAYQSCHVRRLLPFFDHFRDSLHSLSPMERENPRVVLWSEGANQNTYFEQLIVARQLGIPLVEDADLTARNNHIYVKTLGGLRPVRVILRCTEDFLCDPLELNSNPARGVPGLIQAVRAGNVVIANALGSGLVGNASLMPFMPQVARHLLGEDLVINSVPTEWCGDPAVLSRAREENKDVIFKRVGGNGPVECREGNSLSDGERAALFERMRHTPEHYVIQNHLQLSTTPVRTQSGGFQAQPVVVRIFALWSPDGWELLPGGLALTSPAWDSNFISLETATSTKDTWIMSEEPTHGPVKIRSLFPPVEITRTNMDMPSRVADNMFWLGRYVERAEGQIRILRVLLQRLNDETHLNEDYELDVLLSWMVEEHLVPRQLLDARRLNREPELEAGLLKFIFGQEASGLRSLSANLRRTLWLVRDRVSVDAWKFLHRFEKQFPLPGTPQISTISGALEQLDEMILPLIGFSGLAGESMTRGPGWRFLDMGRRIERAFTTAGLLFHGLVKPDEREEPILKLLLSVADSSMTYSNRYQAGTQAHAVLDLLLTDDSNPRSVAYQLSTLSNHVEELIRGLNTSQRTREQNQILHLNTRISLVDVQALVDNKSDGRRKELEVLLDELHTKLPEFSDTLGHRYFSHSDPVRPRERFQT